MELCYDAVLLGGAVEQVAGEDSGLGGILGALAEDLLLPLAPHDLALAEPGSAPCRERA